MPFRWSQWLPAAFCPMGCGATVYRNPKTGNLQCHNETCPRPHAVMDILGEREHQHLVTFNDDEGHFYNIRHPLRERLDDMVLECLAGQVLAGLLDSGFTPETGRIYRLVTVPSGNGSTGENYRLEIIR